MAYFCITSYIAASRGGIANCKCHGKILIGIKCPYNIKNKTTAEGIKECQFLVENDRLFCLSKTHKHYTQIKSQMGVTGTSYCYFFVWTRKDLFVEKIRLNEKLWQIVKTNLEIVYKSFVCPALLE